MRAVPIDCYVDERTAGRQSSSAFNGITSPFLSLYFLEAGNQAIEISRRHIIVVRTDLHRVSAVVGDILEAYKLLLLPNCLSSRGGEDEHLFIAVFGYVKDSVE